MSLHEASQLLLLFGKIGTAIMAIPLIVSIIRWKYMKEWPLKWLFYYFLWLVILNIFSISFVDIATKYYSVVGPYLMKLNIYNTFFLEPLFYLVDIICIGFFCAGIHPNIKTAQTIKKVVWALVFFTVLNTVFGEGYENFQIVGSLAVKGFLLFMAIIILRKVFNSNFNRAVYSIPYFWIAVSLIIGVCGAGLIDSLSNSMYSDSEVVFYQAHVAVDIFYDISYLCMARGVWLIPWHGKLK